MDVDHATLNHWIVRYAPQIADQAQKLKHPTLQSCRVDGSTRDCPVARCARQCFQPIFHSCTTIFQPFPRTQGNGKSGSVSNMEKLPQGIMPSIMAYRSKIFCNSAFNAFGNVVRRLWVGARSLDWQSALIGSRTTQR